MYVIFFILYKHILSIHITINNNNNNNNNNNTNNELYLFFINSLIQFK